MIEPRPTYQPAPHAQVVAQNGLGMTGLICGIIGILFGGMFITFWIAGPFGVAGLILSSEGRGRVKRGEATNYRTAAWGIATSVIALVLSLWGAVEILGTNQI